MKKNARWTRARQAGLVSGVIGVYLFVQTITSGWAAASAQAAASTNVPEVKDSAAASAVPGAHLDYAPGKAPRFWSVAVAETIMARWPDYKLAYHAPWTYVHGYSLYGFEMLYRATGEKKYLDYIKRYIDQFIDEKGDFIPITRNGRPPAVPSFTNQDNMMTGNTLVMLYEYTKDERYKNAATTVRKALDGYPRNSNGGLWHSHGLHGQWWIDGIFMSQMFLIRYGKSIGDSEYCFDEATGQIAAYAKTAEKGGTGMMVHGTYEPGHGDRECRWALPNTGLSPEVWSEGLGWYTLVTVETLATIPKDHPRRAELEAILRRVAAGLKRTQDPKTGGWFTVVDKQDQSGNWIDSSGTAMFVYTIQKGVELGLLDKSEYAPAVEKGLQAIVNLMKINDRGLVDVYSASDGLSVQVDYDHYVNNPRRAVNAKEAVAGVLWATAIVERPALEKLRPTDQLTN
ncbi:MAG: glycosyl hydrolase family 88 [Acidobacteria bacterium]|nr:MAG: glycosyl hydrolase family 88 [Acidobacteriota bacterium]